MSGVRTLTAGVFLGFYCFILYRKVSSGNKCTGAEASLSGLHGHGVKECVRS